MKKKLEDLSEEEKIETLDTLYTAAGSISGREATKKFLKELLTPSERIMLGRRIQIARMLLEGYSQAAIGEKLKVGPNTIWRVEKWLDGQMPGYKQAVLGLEKEMKQREEKRVIAENPFNFAALKKKFPQHFLLFPTPSSSKATKK